MIDSTKGFITSVPLLLLVIYLLVSASAQSVHGPGFFINNEENQNDVLNAHERRYTAGELKRKVEAAGFRLERRMIERHAPIMG